MQDIGAVDDLQRLAHIVVGDQHADAAILEVPDQVADLADRDRVDAGQRLVEQDEVRAASPGRGRSRPRRRSPPDSASAGARRRWAMREFGQQRVEHLLAPVAHRLDHLEHGADIVLDAQAAEDRGLLRQVADAEPGAAVHRQIGDVVAVQQHAALRPAASGR